MSDAARKRFAEHIGKRFSQVWVLRDGPLAPPKQVNVKIGVSDGSVSEIVEGDVKEGDEVITDVADANSKGGAAQQGGPRFRGF